MGIRKHIREELNTVKHSELNTWDNKPNPHKFNDD